MTLLPKTSARSLWGFAGAVGLGLLLLPPSAEEGDPPPELLVPVGVAAAVPVETEELVLPPGGTLGAVLEEASLPARVRNAFLLAFREQADPRRMRAGTPVTLRWVRDSERSLRAVDVAVDPDRTVRVEREGPMWTSSLFETPVTIDTVRAAGVISGSLWAAVVDSPDLAGMLPPDRDFVLHRLDGIFQWRVDFSREILDGDSFRFVMEREVRPDGSLRSARIIAAELVNRGRELHAVWFDPDDDGRGAHYDLDGESVRRAFLRKPLEFRRISSRFTRSRYHPILRTWRAHTGVDYAADAGTPVMATGDGVVVHRGVRGGYGNLVEIRHRNGYTTRYAHLRRFASGLRVGDRVLQGEVIGRVGMTGLATAPHLHYEFRRDGRVLDPLSVDIPAGEPVPGTEFERWERERNERITLLGPAATDGSDSIRMAEEEED